MVWYKTIFLLSTTKKGFSSKEIQRQLGLKRYEPVWAMVHKLQKAMGDRDDRYTLEGMIEVDILISTMIEKIINYDKFYNTLG